LLRAAQVAEVNRNQAPLWPYPARLAARSVSLVAWASQDRSPLARWSLVQVVCHPSRRPEQGFYLRAVVADNSCLRATTSRRTGPGASFVIGVWT